jgi:hypothetical protein
LSQVDEQGMRRVTAGAYKVFVSGAQPMPDTPSAAFNITGTQELPR